MSFHDLMGYTAAVLVFAAFYMKGMIGLRIIGLCSNLAFLVYALGHNLPPIVLLHAMLIPVNGWRLCQQLRGGPEAAASTSERPPPSTGSDPFAPAPIRPHEARAAETSAA